MTWTTMLAPHPAGLATGLRSRTVRRIRLGRAALRYAAHGWDVTPGACFAGSRFACGQLGCLITSCHPALADWARAASHEPLTVAAWWRDAPYTVLLATGHSFDVLEVPAYLGAGVYGRSAFRGGPASGPVAVTPGGRWMFLIRPGQPLRPELDGRPDVVHHGRDSWVPAPPARLLEGPVRWAVSPEETGWRLPEPYAVQQALVEMLDGLAPRSTGCPGPACRPGHPGCAAPTGSLRAAIDIRPAA